MAAEPWNKIIIPYPSASAACRITFNTRTAAVMEAVLEQDQSLLMLLSSHVLHIETRVLQEILYVMHNSFRQHKPFRAIKQVEQCINRLKEMKLQEALQELQELCPNQIQRNVGVDAGYCDVPSQPKLEWFCLKVLGASSLLCRTLDQCTRAFSLIRQHLHLSEFLVLNLVLASLLSRLWVFFRGILRTMMPLYQRSMDLLHEVVQCRPMAFLTEFTLPKDLAAFLGPHYADLLQESNAAEPLGMNNTKESSLLSRIFEGTHEEQFEKGDEEERHMIQLLAHKEMASTIDLGRSVLRHEPPYSRSSSSMDIKLMLQQTSKQHASEVVIKTASPRQRSASSLAVLEQKRMFLQKLKASTSIMETVAHLKEMISWCRRRKLHQEHRYLAFTCLRFQRLKALENEGTGVQKKLWRLRDRVRHAMLKGTSLARHSLFLQRRTRCCFRTRFPTLVRLYGSVRSRFVKVRPRSRIAKVLFNVTSSNARRNDPKVPPFHEDGMSGSDVVVSQKESNKEVETRKSCSARNDEIDHIFASFGF